MCGRVTGGKGEGWREEGLEEGSVERGRVGRGKSGEGKVEEESQWREESGGERRGEDELCIVSGLRAKGGRFGCGAEEGWKAEKWMRKGRKEERKRWRQNGWMMSEGDDVDDGGGGVDEERMDNGGGGGQEKMDNRGGSEYDGMLSGLKCGNEERIKYLRRGRPWGGPRRLNNVARL